MNSLKLRKIGNSLGVILPADVLSQMNASEGDELFLTQNRRGISLTTLSPQQARQMEMAQKLMEENFEMLRMMAK
jgi:putative addiction module antidote